ncbi:MAG: tetratricopeptide repeat protein [Caldilineaceae bacterium]
MRAKVLNRQAYRLATTGIFAGSPYPKGVVEVNLNFAEISYRQGNFETALAQAVRIVEDCKNHGYTEMHCRSLALVGIAALRLGRAADALAHLLRALELSEQTANLECQAIVLNCIAIVHTNVGAHQKALYYFHTCRQLYQRIGDTDGSARALLNLCMSYKDLGDYESALHYGLQSLALLQNTCLIADQLMAHVNLGNVWVALHRNDKAIAHFQTASNLARLSNDKFTLGYLALNLARIYLTLGQFSSAENNAHTALILAETSKQQGAQFEAHELLATIYKASHEFARALWHYERFHAIKEEVFNREAEKKYQLLEVQHQTKVAQKEATILQNKNQALEAEIAERKRIEQELIVAKDAAEQAGKVKDDFLSLMSHELRTPLNTMLGFAQLLALDSTLKAGQREHLAVIEQNGEHLLQLINNILALTKAAAGKESAQISNFDLYLLLHELKKMFSLKATDKEIQLIFTIAAETPQHLFSDKLKLRQILINLIGNAIKFTEQGVVRVAVRWLVDYEPYPPSEQLFDLAIDQQQRLLEFEVSDTGPGITVQERQQLFKKFAQGSAGKNIPEGTGLGLAISQNYVHLLGGDIVVHPGSDGGATVRFFIPYSVAEPAIQSLAAEKLPNQELVYSADTLPLEQRPTERAIIPQHRGPPSF